MYFDEHNPPHFHVQYNEYRASMANSGDIHDNYCQGKNGGFPKPPESTLPILPATTDGSGRIIQHLLLISVLLPLCLTKKGLPCPLSACFMEL
jgi:hypothetical protein